jgi:hypothetical protein
MHLVGETEVGWDEIRASWENLAKICSNGRVELRDQRICVGEDLAYVTGSEHVNLFIMKDQVQGGLRVSNVFRREGSEWKMVHHHLDRNQTMLEILSKVETSHKRKRVGSESAESVSPPTQIISTINKFRAGGREDFA